MNPDNPYAAPQTLETLANPAIALPLAEERADSRVRILFREIDTPALARIEAASRAIRRMTVVWTLGVAVLLIGFIATTMSSGAFGLDWLFLVAGVFALVFRISAGVERGPSERYYSLLVDLAPCLIIFISLCSVLIHWQQYNHVSGKAPLTVLLTLAILYMPVTSVLAHWRYGCLFGGKRLMHDDLARELAHRRRYRIP